jgi:hypothetical protein
MLLTHSQIFTTDAVCLKLDFVEDSQNKLGIDCSVIQAQGHLFVQ